jgi:hypothetical protein
MQTKFSHLATVLALIAASGITSAATLSVGPGKTYPAPCAAFAAAKDGDTIEIDAAGTYRGDVCQIVRNGITIRGVNGRPKIDAGGKVAKDKGIWVIDANDVTVDNVEMFGAASPMSGNGAALRLEMRGFTLRNSYLHDNENGILSNPNGDSDILVEYSEFSRNGRGDGQTHNLYIGRSKSFTMRYSYSHDANVGHNVKSRAVTNTIAYNRFDSTGLGQPSYEVDLPEAGTSYVIGNVIVQPAANQNPGIVSYGAEGGSNPGQDLYFVNNTVINEFASGGTFVFVSGKVTKPALIQNNLFVGAGLLTNQAGAVLKNNARSFGGHLGADLRPVDLALVVDAGTDPGVSPTGVPLAPTSQYKAVAQGEDRPQAGALDIGAYEATGLPRRDTGTTWTDCAAEGKTCAFTGTREVRYGAKDTYTSKVLTASAPCTSAVFGDPVNGTAKSCSYASTTAAVPAQTGPAAGTWVVCAGEGSTCTFTGTREVRFGTPTSFVTKTHTGSVLCLQNWFGPDDPAKGTLKSCSVQVVAPPAPPASTTPAPSADTANAEALGKVLSTILGRTVTVTIK